MPTTANFSLEYPDDNSSVDIAGHFETLADDVDEAINTRLALTGGTLTGALVGTLTTDSSSSTTGAFKTAGGMGIAKALYVGTTLNVAGATTLTGDLTVSKAAPYLTVNSTSGHAYSLMSRPAGSRAWQYFQTAGSTRWTTGVSADAESGANAGSNYTIAAWDDAGSALSTPLTITRSTGATTLTGNLTISKSSPVFTISAGASAAISYMDSNSGHSSNIIMRTGTSNRWTIQKSNTSESGSNAGSDFALIAYSDAGSALSTPLTITRSTGAFTLTGNVLLNKATAELSVFASSGDGGINLQSYAGSYASLRFRTGNTNRWTFNKSNEAESGSNAGSNFQLYKYTDGGSGSVNLAIDRSTGKWTFRDVGSAAGLELGSSGPRIMSGTGSPEGVVTAPIGSIWFQSDSTVGVTHWKKASGSGNTGWVVMEGDTGNRNISADLLVANGFTGVYAMNIRRVGNTVMLMASQLLRASGGSANFYTIPLGFRPDMTAAYGKSFSNNGCYASGSAAYISMAGTSDAGLSLTYTTNDAWPTSLPGSAA